MSSSRSHSRDPMLKHILHRPLPRPHRPRANRPRRHRRTRRPHEDPRRRHPARRHLPSRRRWQIPRPPPAHALRQEQRRRHSAAPPPRAATSSSCRTSAAATPPRASGTPSSTRPTTATTPSSGPPRFPTPTAKSACLADPTSEPRRCSPPSAIRRISPASAPSSPLSNYHENWTYQGGAFEQWFNESWTAGLAQDTLNRAIRRDTNALAARQRSASHAVSRLQHCQAAYGRRTHPSSRPIFPRLGRPH